MLISTGWYPTSSTSMALSRVPNCSSAFAMTKQNSVTIKFFQSIIHFVSHLSNPSHSILTLNVFFR
eukprot:m.59246 g.59246  ORF g.59246 m.59246 type:complete len:66 (+) comp11314_c0_seq2:950-1147(+)